MSALWHGLRGVLSLGLFIALTLVIGVPLVLLSLAKLVLYRSRYRPVLTRWLDKTASAWLSANNAHQRWLLPTQLYLSEPLATSRREWYMLVVNHQSWVDILVMMRVLHGRIPYVKFFIKASLVWIPILGIGFWGLDFPSMRRHTREQIARDPSLAGRDLATTQKQCERYANKPVTIISYLEGTRFTSAKHRRQGQPYRHLLAPRAGGLAFTLAAMKGRITTLLDVTLHYPEGRPSFWQYVCGRVGRVNVKVEPIALDSSWVGDYAQDEAFREQFQARINRLWHDKDERMAQWERGEQLPRLKVNG